MLYRLMMAVFVLVVGTAAYFGVHYAGTVLADDPLPAEEGGKNAVERAAEADRAKPVQNGVVNGISIVPDDSHPPTGSIRGVGSLRHEELPWPVSLHRRQPSRCGQCQRCG